MIQLDIYTEDFKEEYWKAVCEKIDSPKQLKIVNSCRKFLPPDLFKDMEVNFFKQLILAPFETLKKAYIHIVGGNISKMETECFRKTGNKKRVFKKTYETIHDSYKKLADSEVNGMSMRVKIVKNANLTVCPYCNRDYINCRADNVSGAQLDHFFSKSEFPFFAICLYNLIPVCGNCNRVKGAKKLEFASPFDVSINWDDELTFSYSGTNLNDLKIILNYKNNLIHNIEGMRIKEAYQIHIEEVMELIENKQMYNSTQQQEIKEVLAQVNLGDSELKKMIFGPEITKKHMRTKPLGKMMYDLHNELKIYTT